MKNKDDIKYVYALVSKRIKLFRNFRKMTQEELAEKTLFSRGLIGNIESTKTEQTFSLAVLYSFAKALDIPLELFVKEDITEDLRLLGLQSED
ncbi:MAG: helix-turn-helix transcriptional regulator [Bacilli bacterium]|nr:helix-turn-helix transcriptional regulator [Bacilli bacterium]